MRKIEAKLHWAAFRGVDGCIGKMFLRKEWWRSGVNVEAIWSRVLDCVSLY